MNLAARSLFLILMLGSPAMAVAQTAYAVVLGNQKYVVGSSTLRSGLFVSSDAGGSWRHLGPENLKSFSFDAVDSARGRILYIAAGNGVHRSLDSGRSWKIVTGWRMTEVLDVKVDQGDARWIYAATAFGFWRSKDGGESWSQPAGALDSLYIYRIDELEWPGGIYASTDRGIFESLDYGQTWKSVLDVYSRGVFHTGGALPTIATDFGPRLLDRTGTELIGQGVPLVGQQNAPVMNTYDIVFGRDASIYAAGEKGVWRLGTDIGMARWEDITGALPSVATHALAYLADRDILLAGTFGEGVYRRSHTGWVRSGLEGSQVWRLVVKQY